MTPNELMNGDEAEEDVRRITFWGCFLFDKCWSNYLGRLPQLPTSMITVPKPEVFPDEDATSWCPYTDSGFTLANSQPARTRTVALQIIKLCEISNDLHQNFYSPSDLAKAKGKSVELKKLSSIHTRLESWRRDLPKELEPKEGGLSSVLVMHMFFQLLFIHLFRPFLKYTRATSPLPHTVSPSKLCTQAAAMISRLLRLYKRSHGLRQICNIAVYIAHSACIIHLLNLPAKNARRDIIHGVKHLEETAEGWIGARRTLSILAVLARKWNIELPEEAEAVLARTDAKYGSYTGDVSSPSSKNSRALGAVMNPVPSMTQQAQQTPTPVPAQAGFYTNDPVAIGPITRSQSSGASHSIPLTDLESKRGQQYAQVVSKPNQQQMPNRHRPNRSMHARQPVGNSPGNMFGGVEQLLRDSSDWAYQDQVQLATGFENWDTVDATDSSTNWVSGPNRDGGASFPIQQQQVQPTTQPANVAPAYTVANSSSANSAANANSSAFSVMTWMGGANPYTNTMGYDEEEWYR